MATEAQIEANRRNAAKSTGPRTPEGKARVRRNATRHGLCSGIALMAEEGPEFEADFKLLHEDLRIEHQPNGPTEDILVFKMAQSVFFTDRAAVLLADKLNSNDHPDALPHISLMLRYHTTADRAFARHLNDLRKLQNERRQEEENAVAEAEPEQIGFVSQDPEPAPPQTPVAPRETPQADPQIAFRAGNFPNVTPKTGPDPLPKAA
jgi:hypothetical protein